MTKLLQAFGFSRGTLLKLVLFFVSNIVLVALGSAVGFVAGISVRLYGFFGLLATIADVCVR